MAHPVCFGYAPPAAALPVAHAALPPLQRQPVGAIIPPLLPLTIEHCYKWVLDDATAKYVQTARPGTTLFSHTFGDRGLIWQLELYPNGVPGRAGRHVAFGTEGHVQVAVCLKSPNTTAKISFNIKVGKLPPAAREYEFSTLPGSSSSSHCNVFLFSQYAAGNLSWSDFGNGVDGGLSLSVSFLTSEPQGWETMPQGHHASSSLASDLGALLTDGSGDVTLVCGDERLAAHSLILCARSRVFAAQLCGSLAQNRNALPVLPEVTPHALRQLLRFIYTDQLLPPPTPEEATHLLHAAEVYDVRRLYSVCEAALSVSLTVERVAPMLTLADQHGARDLRRAALMFTAANAAAVLATPAWKELVAARPDLVAELLTTLVTGAPPPEEERSAGGERSVRPRVE